MASPKFACVLLICLAVLSAPIAQAITCGQVASSLSPCIRYLQNGPFNPGCCSGLRSLNAAARTTPDRRAACACLKQLSSGIRGINTQLAEGLPGKCGINIPYKISTSTNCATIS